MYCGNCGTENSKNAKFCKNCGNSLTAENSNQNVTDLHEKQGLSENQDTSQFDLNQILQKMKKKENIMLQIVHFLKAILKKQKKIVKVF